VNEDCSVARELFENKGALHPELIAHMKTCVICQALEREDREIHKEIFEKVTLPALKKAIQKRKKRKE
jgi:hypothetical protein